LRPFLRLFPPHTCNKTRSRTIISRSNINSTQCILPLPNTSRRGRSPG
jgi:hypothetical protein